MMKKITKAFFLPLMLAFVLTGCNKSGGDDDPSDEGGDSLAYTKEQAANKLYDYGVSTGFEIKLRTVSDEEVSETATFGFKGTKAWYASGDEHPTGYELVNNSSIKSYAYNTDTSSYTSLDLPIENPAETFREFVTASTIYFYAASSYSGLDGFHRVKETTYIGRSATEYSVSVMTLGAAATWTAIVDNDLGITLKWSIAASSSSGTESGSIEMTQFKTGNDVVVPF